MLTNRLKVIYVEQPVLQASTQASYTQISDDFSEVFFCFCPFKLDADPVQKVFTAARLPANTCPSLYLRLSASQVHSAFFLRETVGGNNRAFMSHRETFVADLRRHFFPMTLLFREQQSIWTLSSSASREHVPTCLKWPPLAHLYQTGLLYQTCSFFLSTVASQSTDFAFVSCRVHWVPTV